MTDLETCPQCGALPCDWVDNPHGKAQLMSPAETISKIAEIAEAVGWQAGIGGSETAGMIVSYLAKHPDETETILANGILDLPDQWWAQGRLTWQGMNGKIVKPQQARFARIVGDMKAKP